MAARFPDNKAQDMVSGSREASRSDVKVLKRSSPYDECLAKRPKMSDDDIPCTSHETPCPSDAERYHAPSSVPVSTRVHDDGEVKVSQGPPEPDSSSDSDSAVKEVVKLRHESTIGTDLYNNCTGLHSCVLSTGEVVLHGSKTTSDVDRYKFYFFNRDGKIRGRPIDTLCQHDLYNNILSLTIREQEYLCNSCLICRQIRLIDLESNDVIMAYDADIWKMCHGKKGELYIASAGKISILDVTTTSFALKHTFPEIDNMRPDHMCYISESGLLVFSSQKKMFHAINREGYTVWDTSAQIFDRSRCELLGLIYHPGTKMLVAGDHANNMLIVVDGQTGQVLQSEPLENKLFDLHLRDGELVIRHGPVMKISFYSMTTAVGDPTESQSENIIQENSSIHRKGSVPARPSVADDIITRKRHHGKSDELNDNQLSQLASLISATAMRTIALEYFDIDNVSIDDIETSRRQDMKQFKLDLLIRWRNQNRPSKQDLEDIMVKASGKGLVNRAEVEKILKI